MGTKKCPGQSKQYWQPDDIFYAKCIHCENELEFWKDDIFRICSKCNKKVFNPKINLGCIEWCKYAKECVGETEYNRLKTKFDEDKDKSS